LFRSFVTNAADPHDEIPIMIGKLCIDVTKKTKIELQSGLTRARQYEQEQALKGKHLLNNIYRVKINLKLKF
jgi:hypothetical protein